MTSPTIDASSPGTQNAWSTSSSGTVTVSTTSSNGLCVVVIGYELGSGAPHVTSVTSAHLTFTKQARYAPGSTNNSTIEIWTAPISGTLSSEVITVTTNINVDDGCIIGFGVNGLYSNSTPFDSNVGLPAVAHTLGTPTVTYSTSQADDLLTFVQCGDRLGSGGTNPSGWTTLASITNSGGANFCGLGVFTKSVSSPQTSQTVAAGGVPVNSDSVALATAFTADNPITARNRRIVAIMD